MAYGLGDAIIKLIDQVGTSQDDVSAPENGATILYTTEQGLVLERSPSEEFGSRQWFLDQPVLLTGIEPVSLVLEPTSIITPYTVPDDIDASLPTVYRIELQVVVENFAPQETSIGILVQVFVDGEADFSAILVPCDAATGYGCSTVTLLTLAETGLEIDVRAYLLNGDDYATAYATVGVLKRELRLSGGP
jgi:hypothetical protein